MAAGRRRSSNDQSLRGPSTTKRASAHSRVTAGQTSPDRRARNAQPLRRGDACLMCRAKKLKCSATKPSCDQCTRRNDRCVYDAVRPASRVEKLGRKLAELGAVDMHAPGAASRHSLSRSATMTSPPINGPLSRTPEHAPLFEYSAMPFSSAAPVPIQHRATAQAGPSRASSLDSLPPDTRTNNQSWSWSSTGHTSYQQAEMATSAPTYSTSLPWTVLSSTNHASPVPAFWPPPTAQPVTDPAVNLGNHPADPPPALGLLTPSMTVMDSTQMHVPIYAPQPTYNSYSPHPLRHSSPYPIIHDLKTLPHLGSNPEAEGFVSVPSGIHTATGGHLTGSDANGTPLLQPSPLSYPQLNLNQLHLDPSSFPPQSMAQLEEKDVSQAAREYLRVDPWLYNVEEGVYSVY